MSYRVYQWASGSVGQHVARAVVAREGLELVGLHVVQTDKSGQPVSDLIGADCGALQATNDIAAVLDSDADVVVHAPLASQVYGDNPEQDLEDICALLAGGKNVITVVGFLYPTALGGDVAARLKDACQAGGSSFHGTGLNPGWMGDLLPLSMSALSRRLENIHVLEISNFQYYPSPEIMFGSMGFGATEADFRAHGERRKHWLDGLFTESVTLVADGLGLALDEVRSEMTLALAERDLDTAAGTVAAGTVAGQHWRWCGVRDGQERIVHETVWRMHADVAAGWPTGSHSVRLTGEPVIKLSLDGDYVSDGLQATAMHAVNAIPHVCVSPPGIRTLLDLPAIAGYGAFDQST